MAKTLFTNINDIKPYKYNNLSLLGKSINCYKFSHLIKNRGNYIVVNDDPTEYLPIVTISTNTDAGRNLTKDSFALLKFIEDNNDLLNKCVDSDSPDENTLIFNNLILKLAKESYKVNNRISDANIDKYNRLKELIRTNFTKLKGGVTNQLNLEIYEYKLQNYPGALPTTEINTTEIITTKLIDSSDDICGIIEYIDETKTKTKTETEKKKSIRSCDPIHGNLKKKDITDAKKKDNLFPTVSENYNFKLFDITSEDLIKFTNIYGAKKTERPEVKPIDDRIVTMSFFYDDIKIIDLFTKIKVILSKDWINPDDPTSIPDNNNSLIKIIRPTINEKFIIMGDFHGSFMTFIRHLLRFREIGIMSNTCELDKDYHLIFLGDIVDRGIYGYEIMILLYLLKLRNPNNVHINRGNHEEEDTNWEYGLSFQMKKQFHKFDLFFSLNDTMIYQHSAILIKDPNDEKYIYLAHGGLPTTTSSSENQIHKDFKIPLINNIKINEGKRSNIRWNDFYGNLISTDNPSRGSDGILFIGQDLLKIVQDKPYEIKLIIRAHQDGDFNTKLILPLKT
jgi:hypothetical protein